MNERQDEAELREVSWRELALKLDVGNQNGLRSEGGFHIPSRKGKESLAIMEFPDLEQDGSM